MHQKILWLFFDIDDTLLTSDTFFGSDHWYEWQKNLKYDNPSYVPCKFDVTAINYEMGTQHPVEPEAVGIVNSVKVNMMFLTARNSAYRGATERELKRAQYKFPRSILAKESDTNKPDGLIFRWKDPESDREADVSYWNGIYMVGGLGKGSALVELLRRAGKKYDKVILVDDGWKNIESMQSAMDKNNMSYVGFHYLRVSKGLPLYKEMVETSNNSWSGMKQYMNQTFPNRAMNFEKSDCHY